MAEMPVWDQVVVMAVHTNAEVVLAAIGPKKDQKLNWTGPIRTGLTVVVACFSNNTTRLI